MTELTTIEITLLKIAGPNDDESVDQFSLQLFVPLLIAAPTATVVEAGTYKGLFAIAMAKLFGEQRHIYTADPIDHIAQRENVSQFSDIITLYQGDFVDMLEELDLRDIGFAFIDSGPPTVGMREGAMRLRHYEAVKPRMAPGGFIAVHDTARTWNADDDYVRETLLANAHLRFPCLPGISVEQIPWA